MTYLIDTDWVIDHLNHIERVTSRLEELAPAGLALSTISLAELYEGVYYSRDPVESEAALQRFLNPELTPVAVMGSACRKLCVSSRTRASAPGMSCTSRSTNARPAVPWVSWTRSLISSANVWPFV